MACNATQAQTAALSTATHKLQNLSKLQNLCKLQNLSNTEMLQNLSKLLLHLGLSTSSSMPFSQGLAFSPPCWRR